MGLRTYDQNKPNSTPKLTLSKLPSKPKQPIQMLTPSLHPSLSIPFQWEEAPGKPRAIAEVAAPPLAADITPPPSMNKVARCLDLPPGRLNDDAKITIMSSPIMVMDGPYVGRSLSLACTFSFRKGLVTGRENGLKIKNKNKDRNFGSGRWGSFKEEGDKFDDGGSFDFSHSLGDVFKSEKNVKSMKVKRKMSFFSFSSMNSNLLADIYASFKQAVPWRRR